MRLLGLKTLLAIAAIGGTSAAVASKAFVSIDIGNLGGTFGTIGRGVSADGFVTGLSSAPKSQLDPLGVDHAFLYRDGGITDLGQPGTTSAGNAVNASGQVTGDLGNPATAFRLSSGQMQDLGTLGGRTSSGVAINEGGDVVGHSYLAGDSTRHAFVYRSGAMMDIGTLGGTNSFATAINGAGSIAGTSDVVGDAQSHAFLYSNGSMLDIGSSLGVSSRAVAVNDFGEVLVAATDQPYVYANGVLTALPGWQTLGGFSCRPAAMNNAMEIVGTCAVPFYYANGQLVPLQSLIIGGPAAGPFGLVPCSECARSSPDINDAGQIVMVNTQPLFAGTFSRTYLLTPVALRTVQFSLSVRAASDIVWRASTGEVAAWQMQGFNGSSCSFQGPDPGYWRVAGFGDFDGDGKADVLWRSVVGDVAIWLMDGCSVRDKLDAGPGYVSPFEWLLAGVGDFNGDGKADLMWFNLLTGAASVWFMNGATVSQSISFWGAAPHYWMPEAVADFDGDGKADVLWRANDGQVVVWRMDAGGVRESMDFGYAPRATWELAGVGDFNNDHRVDVVWRNRVDGNLALWLADLPNQLPGSGTIEGEDPSYWTVLGVADYDGDGNADILWQSKAGDVSIWLMSGTTVRAKGPAGSGWVSSIWTAQP